MPTIDVRTLDNEKSGQVELSDGVFLAIRREALVYETVKEHMANRRKGCASTKTRADVSGSGKKPWRQKGTGRARSGERRSPVWRHGGTIFGPLPRSYAQAMPRKARKEAMRSALSSKVAENRIVAVEKLSVAGPKTKEFVAWLKKFELLGGGSVLLVNDVHDTNLVLSSRNVPGVKLVSPSELTVYDVLKHQTVVFSRGALEKVETIYRK
jgi:large subunit ribosomal protein L4